METKGKDIYDFYEEIDEDARLKRAKVNSNVDMIYSIGTENNLNDTDFSKWMDIHYKTCEDRNIIGLSEHGLFIGRKGV